MVRHKAVFPFMMLPAELSLMILDLLANDHNVLYILSLVSGLLRVYSLPRYLRATGLLGPSGHEFPIITYKLTRALIVWRGVHGLVPPQSISILIGADSYRACRQIRALADTFVGNSIPDVSIQVQRVHFPTLLCDFLQAVVHSGITRLRLSSSVSTTFLSIESPEDIPFVNSGLFYPHLQNMEIKAPVFFSIYIIKWTIQTLNSATLTTLDLRMGLNPTYSPPWRHILPRLTLDHLQTFSIDGSLPVATIFRFLFQHPRLRELRLGRLTRPGFPLAVPHAPIMPHLDVLVGSHEYIVPLLSRGIPRLTYLGVIPDFPYCAGPYFDSHYRDVMKAAQGCPNLEEVSVGLPYGYIAQDTDGSFFYARDVRHQRGERRLSSVRMVTIRAAWDVEEFMMACIHPSVLVSNHRLSESGRLHSSRSICTDG